MAFFSRTRRRKSRLRSIQRRPPSRLEALEHRCVLNAGALDPTFGIGGLVTTDIGGFLVPSNNGASAVLADGKIVVAGSCGVGLASDFAVARYNADGSLDSTFGTGGRMTIDFGSTPDFGVSVAMQGAKIIVVGNSSSNFAVARLNADGTLDETFDGDGKEMIDFTEPYSVDQWRDDTVGGVLVQGDKIIVTGASVTVDDVGAPIGDADFAMARLLANGPLDNTFGIDGRLTIDFFGSDDYAGPVAMQGSKLVVAGSAYHDATGTDFAVARLNDDGSLDTSFADDGRQTVDFGSDEFGSFDVSSAMAVSGDRIVLAGLSFDGATNYDFAVARLNDDGTLDGAFDGDGKQTIDFGSDRDFGRAMAMQGDQIVIAGGSSQGTTGVDFAVARLNSDGTLDSSFDGDGKQTIDFGADDDGEGVAVQADGTIVVVGVGASAPQVLSPSSPDFAVARLNDNGTLDSTFDGDGKVLTDFLYPSPSSSSDTADSVVVQGDKIVVVGGGGPFGQDFAVARYNADGSLDSTFGTDGRVLIDFGAFAIARSVALQGDKILVAGTTSQTGFNDGSNDFAVARLNSDGTLDTTFDGDGRQTIDFGGGDGLTGVAAQAERIVLVGGSFDDFAVARLNSDGSLDTSFADDGLQTVDFGSDEFGPTVDVATAVAVQGDTIVVAGYSQQALTGQDFAVARLNDDGTLDISFDGDGKQTIDFAGLHNVGLGVAIQGDRVLVAGYTQSATDLDFAVARLNKDGTPDSSFDGDGKQTIDFGPSFDVADAVAVQGDTIVVSGYSNQSLTGQDFAVARLNGDGTLDTAFGAGGKQTIDFGSLIDQGFGVAVQSDGNIVVAGSSDQGATSYDFAVARVVGLGNTAPTISAVSSQEYSETELTVQVTATDPDAGDSLSYSVSFVSKTGAGAVNAPIGFSIDGNGLFHWTPGAGQLGQYTFVVEVEDSGGRSTEQTFVVTTLGVVDGVLTIVGTDGADKIEVRPTDGDADDLTVRINEKDLHYKLKPRNNPDNPYTGVLSIYIRSLGGDDQVTVGGNVTVPAWVFGGSGDDRLKGGGGSSVLLGGPGDDVLAGAAGRDLLIGGTGEDRISGNADDDILIAGSTAYDAFDAALAAVLAEWNSTRSYADRVKNLRGDATSATFGARVNGDFFLAVDGSHGRAVAVFDDGVKDVLTGDGGQDWFLFNADGDNDATKDKVTDLGAVEFKDDLDFINGP